MSVLKGLFRFFPGLTKCYCQTLVKTAKYIFTMHNFIFSKNSDILSFSTHNCNGSVVQVRFTLKKYLRTVEVPENCGST